MSIQSQIDRIKSNLSAAYDALAAKGIEVGGGSDRLADAIKKIKIDEGEIDFSGSPQKIDVVLSGVYIPTSNTDRGPVLEGYGENDYYLREAVIFSNSKIYNKNIIEEAFYIGMSDDPYTGLDYREKSVGAIFVYGNQSGNNIVLYKTLHNNTLTNSNRTTQSVFANNLRTILTAPCTTTSSSNQLYFGASVPYYYIIGLGKR